MTEWWQEVTHYMTLHQKNPLTSQRKTHEVTHKKKNEWKANDITNQFQNGHAAKQALWLVMKHKKWKQMIVCEFTHVGSMERPFYKRHAIPHLFMLYSSSGSPLQILSKVFCHPLSCSLIGCNCYLDFCNSAFTLFYYLGALQPYLVDSNSKSGWKNQTNQRHFHWDKVLKWVWWRK